MDLDLTPYTKEYDAWLIKLASDNLSRGIIEEPRAYYDEIEVSATTGIITRSSPEVFQNGERFPVKITHMTCGIQYLTTEADPEVADERNIQRVGLGLRFHDQWYMNDRYIAAPLWATGVCTAPLQTSQSTACWRFDRPFILSSRDSLAVKVGLIEGQDTAVPVTVAFTGIGIKSKRPYFFAGDTALTDTVMTSIPGGNYKNDGAEPVLVTDMTVNVAAPLGTLDPTGDIRNLRIQVSQLGNGTNSSWFIGPRTIVPPLLGIGAQNLGVYTGRVVVHRFPMDGLLWEPGEGIDIFVQRLSTATEAQDFKLSIALLGNIVVQ